MLAVDARQLRRLGTELRKSQPLVYAELRKAMRVEAKVIKADAKSRASWSTRIPASIRTSTSALNTISIKAGGAKAPDAAPYEHAGKTGSFRHPVFADARKPRSDWTWVNEKARPFLHPAVMARLEETVKILGTAVVTAVDHAVGKAKI